MVSLNRIYDGRGSWLTVPGGKGLTVLKSIISGHCASLRGEERSTSVQCRFYVNILLQTVQGVVEYDMEALGVDMLDVKYIQDINLLDLTKYINSVQ